MLEPRVGCREMRAGGLVEDRGPLDEDRALETGVRALAWPTVELAVIGLAYFVFAKVGLALASINSSGTSFWPPTGVAL
jgi:hypothetical protein